jgi:HAE1 family hydrophobic/amphiphilic exporter-1
MPSRPPVASGPSRRPRARKCSFNVRALGLLKDPKEFEEIIIRSNPNGSQVKVKDVGAWNSARKPMTCAADSTGGKQSTSGALGIFLAPGANAIDTAENVKKILETAKAQFPPDMAYDVVMDSTLPIKASMESIVHTLFEAVVLVLIVVYLFLQSFRATIIPMCTVPVSLLGAFIMFPVLGLQRERADDVRPRAGHRHRGGRRDCRRRGGATSPRTWQGAGRRRRSWR